MSVVAFKNTSVTRYATKHIGKGGIWNSRGPFGPKASQSAVSDYGPVGFSLEGPYRNVGYIGKESKMSSNGTPFRGQYAMGHGAKNNRYPYTPPVYNVNECIVLGNQHLFVKPSVLSTRGMLQEKYKWINNGQWPNFWVKNIFPASNLKDTASQGLYVHTKTTKNMCVNDTNNVKKYIDFIKCYQPNLLGNSTANFTYDDLARNGPYGKTLYQPVTSSQQTLQIQRQCGRFPHIPIATNGNFLCANAISDVNL